MNDFKKTTDVIVDGIRALNDDIDRLSKQNIELIEVLEEIMNRPDDVLDKWLYSFEINKARQAIAKAKGES